MVVGGADDFLVCAMRLKKVRRAIPALGSQKQERRASPLSYGVVRLKNSVRVVI
jgi:hypothetical protein